MSQEKRFPSPANVSVDRSGRAAAKVVDGPMAASMSVEAKKQNLCEVHFTGENHVVLHNGVHVLAKGINHVPAEVMAESAKHPHIAKLMKDGVISMVEAKAEAKEEEKPAAKKPSK